MKWMILALLLALLVGYDFGRWDARHGEDAGLRAGKWVRSWFVKDTQP